MTQIEYASESAADLEVAQRWLPALLLLFIGSGCAALIYEVVWFQLLQLSVGSSAVSLGILLGVFMGGMCLGSICCLVVSTPRTIRCASTRVSSSASAVRHPRAVRCAASRRRLRVHRGHGPGQPLSARHRGRHLPASSHVPDGGNVARHRTLGRNNAHRSVVARIFLRRQSGGAVAGSLLAGFYLLRLYDMPTATYVAVALNVVVALLALAIARVTPYRPKVVGTVHAGGRSA
jgi:spermidine synthase